MDSLELRVHKFASLFAIIGIGVELEQALGGVELWQGFGFVVDSTDELVTQPSVVEDA